VFPHFCGILLTGTGYLLLYCVISRNKPRVYPSAILPGFLSGSLWAISQICWFIANSSLGMVITFPVLATGPSIVANLWGVMYAAAASDLPLTIPLMLPFFSLCQRVS